MVADDCLEANKALQCCVSVVVSL